MKLLFIKYYKLNLFSPKKGFTIIEILLVIGIITILMTISIIAINPFKNYQTTYDLKRKTDLSEMQKSFLSFFVENKEFLSNEQYNALNCNSPLPSPLIPYLPSLPCDPQSSQKYTYQALDNNCQLCLPPDRCTGFRLLTTLKNENDGAIINAGCDPVSGCGITSEDGNITNYGVSYSCSVKATPMPLTPTLDPQISQQPSVTPNSLTITPGITPGFTIIPTIQITPVSGFAPNPIYDTARVNDLFSIALALEKYRFLNSQYPFCTSGWQLVSDCLDTPINNFLFNSTLPSDPENGNPYLYLSYASGNEGSNIDGYCLSAHLANPTVYLSLINCPISSASVNYEFRFRERKEIIYRPTPNPLTNNEKTANDSQRIADLLYFKNMMEQYKIDYGHYPTCWLTENTWAATGSGDFFCRGELISYGSNFNYDPGGVFSYNIIQWDPDINGYFQKYCFASYMDSSANTTCLLDCPVNSYDSNYCYFIKNP
jgi:prepilin-type N-terminal cleavage/methylation domain-containing protein